MYGLCLAIYVCSAHAWIILLWNVLLLPTFQSRRPNHVSRDPTMVFRRSVADYSVIFNRRAGLRLVSLVGLTRTLKISMLSLLSKDANIPSRARLLPIDLEDAAECSVLFDQRTVCGWGQHKIPAWRESMHKGERTLFWITLPLEMRKDDAAILKRDAETFIPAGHVSLDRVDSPSPGMDPDPTLVAPDGSVLTVSSLFVLPVFSGCGLGRFALRECERIAQQEPYGSLNCRFLSLWALSDRYSAGGDEGWDGIRRWERLGMPVPTRANGPWYESLGYTKYKEEIRLDFGLPNEQMMWYGVFFRKELR